MKNSLVTINLVVLNGEKYICHCLESVKKQTYPHDQIELKILDNGSTDETKKIIGNWKLEIGNSSFATFNFIESGQNLGMWPGHEELLKDSNGEYVVVLSVDVILDKDFVSNAVGAMSKDEKIGAVQAKVYRYDLSDLKIKNNRAKPSSGLYGHWKLKIGGTIDTCGFQIYKSRRIINIGHGEEDSGQFSQEQEIFAVEGAVP